LPKAGARASRQLALRLAGRSGAASALLFPRERACRMGFGSPGAAWLAGERVGRGVDVGGA
jgi:hypothetical protein